MQQRGAMAAIQALETKSDEELERETRYKSAALSILGARAAERYDAKKARNYFQQAIAVASPQERMQIRRMRDASLALAERRPDDLKNAVQKLGQEAPSSRQLFMLRLMGLISPAAGASLLARIRGVFVIIFIIALLVAVGFGVVKLVSLPFGGVGLVSGLLLGLVVVVIALVVLSLLGRRKQRAMQQQRAG